MDKEDVVCTHTHTHTPMEYYSAIRKNEIMPFAATWMDLEIIILSEVSQTKKDKYSMISLICGILKNDTGTSLVAQWIRLCAPNAGGLGSIPGQGTRSHMRATTKEPSCYN